MSKKTSSLFCSMLLAFAFAVVFTVLSACGGSSNSSGEGDKSSSSGGSTYRPSSAVASANVTLKDFRVTPSSDWKEVDVYVKVGIFFEEGTDEDLTFDSVVVKLDGVNIDKKTDVREYSYDNYASITDSRYCNKETSVCIDAYLKDASGVSKRFGDKDGQDMCKFFNKECISSSSAEPSSSSAAPPKTFSYVDEFILNSNEARTSKGLTFNSGSVSLAATASASDIYLDSRSLNSDKSNITIISCFTDASGCGGKTNVNVPNPSNTSDFNFRTNITDDFPFDIMANGAYYMIRTTNTAEWNSDCYLLMTEKKPEGNASNWAATIKVWKVN